MTTYETEAAFHLARRMFATMDGTVLIAPANCPMSHYEWLGAVVGGTLRDTWMMDATRGYALDGRLVAYRGLDFLHRVDVQAVVQLIMVMEPLCGIVHEVGFGAIPGPTQPWKPKKLYASEDFLRQAALAERPDA